MERIELSGEALIALNILKEEHQACEGTLGEGVLGENNIILYGTCRERLKSLDELDAAQLLSIVRAAKERLEAFRQAEGCDAESGAACSCADRRDSVNRQDETIRITKDLRIMLPGRGGEEIRMRPMTKSVFLLFLRHPEGIRFKEIGDYEEELTGFYSKLSRHTDLEQFSKSLRRVLGQEDCTLSIAASRLTSKMKSLFGDGLWEKYTIRGAAGEAKSIALDRKYVIWE